MSTMEKFFLQLYRFGIYIIRHSGFIQGMDSKKPITKGFSLRIFLFMSIPLSLVGASVYNLYISEARENTLGASEIELSALPLLDPSASFFQNISTKDIHINDGIALSRPSGLYGVDYEPLWMHVTDTSIIHLVRPGDTWESIAYLYNKDALWLQSVNHHLSTPILAGDMVIIPLDEGFIDDQEYNWYHVHGYEESLLQAYSFPCDCYVTQGYGATSFARASSFYTSNWHDGVDFSNVHGVGTPLVAMDDGVVTQAVSAGYNGGYGLYVKILHDTGEELLYAHMHEIFVQPGDHVLRGEAIGTMGISGRSTGPHVHIESSVPTTELYHVFPAR